MSVPQVHIESDGKTFCIPQPMAGVNAIKVKIKGRNLAQESSEPRISVETYKLGTSQQSSNQRSFTAPESQAYSDGTPIKIKHITNSYTASSAPQDITASLDKARRLDTRNDFQRQEQWSDLKAKDLFSVNKAEEMLRCTRKPLLDLRKGVDIESFFDKCKKDFDLFSSESKSLFKSYDRSRSRLWDYDLDTPVQNHFTSNKNLHSNNQDDLHPVQDNPPSSHYTEYKNQKCHSVDTDDFGHRNRDFNDVKMSTTKVSMTTTHPAVEDSLSNQSNRSEAIYKAKRVLDRVLKDLEDADSGYSGSGEVKAQFTLTKEEIKNKIKIFNDSHATQQLTQDRSDDRTFNGQISIHICLDKMVTMMLQPQGTTLHDTLYSIPTPCNSIKAAVTLPKHTVMGVHISSLDTADKVIELFLKKFSICDEYKSFSLYEQTLREEKEVNLRKVSSSERPLENYLQWDMESSTSKRFILKENDSAEVMWEAFSLPELHNFLDMLKFQQEKQEETIRLKYHSRRIVLENKLKELT